MLFGRGHTKAHHDKHTELEYEFRYWPLQRKFRVSNSLDLVVIVNEVEIGQRQEY